jgi:5-methyltetrahydrofolate--homocysteine methyltransferase
MRIVSNQRAWRYRSRGSEASPRICGARWFPVAEILEQGLLAGMGVVGERMKNNEVFIPEVLMSAHALHDGLALLKPLYMASGVEPKGKMVIGTVQSDVHSIGKSLVAMVAEGAGFEVEDLGVDVSTERFVAAVKEKDPDVLALSALLTTTMPNMERVINALDEEGLRPRVKVIVGGAAVTQEFADAIGADSYAPDAASAVDSVLGLVGEVTAAMRAHDPVDATRA